MDTGVENVVCPNCASEDWIDITGFESWPGSQFICNECGFRWEVEK